MTEHHTEQEIICPNCGSTAKGNYCCQCGQETHLHKETFWGLVMHFIGHYFHYDSKFWQTMKALWFSPGKLTIAYVNKQRMRYIPPISLYIFISAVFFLIYFSADHREEKTIVTVTDGKTTRTEATIKNIHTLRNALDSLDREGNTTASKRGSLGPYMDSQTDKIREKYGKDFGEFFRENIKHSFPKIFFFMIPMMAVLLKMMFARRKTAYFVDHAIFSLHFHAFCFSLFILPMIPFPYDVQSILEQVFFIVALVYMVIALRKVYSIGVFRAILSMLTISIGYLLFFLIAIFIDFMLIIAMA